MRPVFVDTNVWVAFHQKVDGNHDRARELLGGMKGVTLVLTEHVLSETATLLRRAWDAERVASLAADFLEGRIGQLIRCSEADERDALTLIRKFREIRLSFADATSMAVVRRLNIQEVASFDRDFRIVLNDRTVLPGP